MLEYREFTLKDTQAVMALELRPIEIREGRASTGFTQDEALASSLLLSQHKYVMTYWGKICGVFGLATTMYDDLTIGAPWLLTNEVPHLERALFLRTSRQIVAHWKTKCHMLVNIISTENERSLKWLRWLGFTISDKPITFDRDPDFPFVEFWMYGTKGETHV